MEFISLIIYLLVLIPSLIYKLVLKLSKKEIWLIAENKDTASDNGYYLFKYIRENHPNDLVYYVISKKCKDYKKVSKLGNVINWGSLKHYLYYLVSKNITTNELSSPSPKLFNFLHIYLNLYNNRVFLQRGITSTNNSSLHYNKTKFKLFICGAKKEYEYIKENFEYPNEKVKYLGFPRFDDFNSNVGNKEILIMPTYRKWIGKDIKSTNYYKRWQSLLNNNELINFIEENHIIINFCLHNKFKKYIDSFSSKSSNINILKDASINELLKNSSLLITDYSSVYMDFAYMSKPIIYYQFDNMEYKNNGNNEGYFKFSKDAFGKIILDEEDVIKKVEAYVLLDYKIEKTYKDRMNSFFVEKDNLNSKRVYEAIKEV